MKRQPGNSPNGHLETDMFDLGGVIQIFEEAIRHHKMLILLMGVLTVAAAGWYVHAWPPIYRVQAQLASERDLDPSRDPFYSNWQVFRKDDPRDEILLFTSGPVLRDVISRNKLTYDDVYHSFPAHASYMWRKSWLGTRYKELHDKFLPDPDAPKPSDDDLGETMQALKNSVTIVGEGDTNVATLTVLGPSRRVSVIANSLIDSYLSYRKKRHHDEAQSAFEVLNQQADLAKRELEEARDRREGYAREHGLLIDFLKQTQDVAQLTDLETRIAGHRSTAAYLEASLRQVNAELSNEPEDKVVSSTKELNPVRETAKMRRLEQQAALIGLRDRYRQDSPEVQETLGTIAKLDALISQEPEQIDRSVTKGANAVHQQLIANRDKLQSDLEGERSALAVQEQTAAQMRQRLAELPTLMGAATDLSRDYDIAKDKYQRLLMRRTEAEVSATAVEAAPASVRVIDYAMPPAVKYWPRLMYLYPGALMLGLAIGLIAAVIRGQTSGRVRRSHVDRGKIATPLYATIDVGGWIPTLTVVSPREKDGGLRSPNVPLKESDRSHEAGS